ncbi:unnamed protein product [Auanema sp. JU1783]|nr:unnamed protein product [Auanema sp. JU1783]
MNDEDEEFEDALDSLEASVTSSNVPQPRSSLVPSAEHISRPDELLLPSQTKYSPSRGPTFPFPGPHSVSTPQDSVVGSSRRERLTAFRNRMKEEFGARESFTPAVLHGDSDGISIISDTTSLHSWHRRVLAGPETVIVLPSDSVSTRAPSTSGANNNSFGSPLETVNRICTVPENSSIDHYPQEPTHIVHKMYSPSSMVSSPTGPPPKHPPPPLPSRERTGSVGSNLEYNCKKSIQAPSPLTDLRTPPPLPPRNPSIRLPDPVASEVVARLAALEDENSHTPVAMTSSDSISSQGVSNKSQRVSTNSNDSISSISENGTRRRGHNKTNSLDRGLTLAKTLKAGPFPPPSNKSNSLKRPAETEGEEGERNSAAAGVIMQITTGILPDKIPPETLEPITSGSSSVSSPSSHVSKEKKNETEAERSSYIDNLNAHCAQEEIISEFESRMPSTSLSSSIDPITRDVERRMSMKRDGTLNDSIW